MIPVHLFGFYGLYGGPFPLGLGFSRGVDTFGKAAAARFKQVIWHGSRDWIFWAATLSEIRQLPAGARVAIVDHSFGAGAKTWVCNSLEPGSDDEREIAATISFDASVFPPGNPAPLQGNVKAALSIVGTENGSIPGHACLTAAEGADLQITRVDTHLPHTVIDDDPALRELALGWFGGAIA